MKGYHHKEKGVGIIFNDIYLLNGKRTAFGKYCGTLSQVSPTDLGIFSSRAVLQSAKIQATEIDQVIVANIGQSSCDAYFLPRHISLYSGIPFEVPSLMVQRICGSGFETIITAAEQIELDKASLVLCCGTENMSLSPTVSFGNRMGYPLGRPVFKDMLWEALDDTAAGYPMGYTAENIAKKYSITRQDCDEFAYNSFQKALDGRGRNIFAEEITPVYNCEFEIEGLKTRKVTLPKNNPECFADEHIRETRLDDLSRLPTVFEKVGVLTAGNSSGIVDGAVSVIVGSKAQIEKYSDQPISRLVAAVSVGIDPKFMGLGPVSAIKYLLEITGMTLAQIGLIEINEAFSAQVIGCIRALELDTSKLNVNGGAIAMGHPLAATGLRLSLTLSKEMSRRKVQYGIASACIGGGQGTAILLENVNS